MAQETEEKKKAKQINEFIPFYFSDFVKGFFKFWWLLVILAVLFGGVRFYNSYKKYRPNYVASATFTISTSTSSSRADGGMTSYSFYYDSATALQLSNTFPFILSSNILQDAISEELGLSYLPVSLRASSVSGSNMFTITCEGGDPQTVYDVLLCAIDKFPEAARYVVGRIRFTMITNPYLPTAPSNPNSFVREGIEAAVVGILIGLAWILLYCVSRKTIRTKDEISEQLGVEALGTLPAVTFKRYKQEIDRSVLWTNPNVGRGFLESLRLLRNNFMRALKPGEKTVLITSTAPGEGKTTVVVNLALSINSLGKRVLLIDWDIRNPSVCGQLNLDIKALNIDSGDQPYALLELKEYGIWLLVFTSRENYWKRMRAEFVKSVLDQMQDYFDLILVDTPPCGLISDTSVIAQSVDAALYVVLQDTVRVSRIRTGLDELMAADVRILGCVFNGAESGVTGYGENYGYSRYSYYGKYGYYGYGKYYGYGYGKYYGYGYGYGYGEEKKSHKHSKHSKHSKSGSGSSHSGSVSSGGSSHSSGGSSHSGTSSSHSSTSSSSHGSGSSHSSGKHGKHSSKHSDGSSKHSSKHSDGSSKHSSKHSDGSGKHSGKHHSSKKGSGSSGSGQ